MPAHGQQWIAQCGDVRDAWRVNPSSQDISEDDRR